MPACRRRERRTLAFGAAQPPRKENWTKSRKAEKGRGGRSTLVSLVVPAPGKTWQARHEQGQACDA